MPMIYLNRIHSDIYSTKGVLVYGKKVLCHTLELPWRNNRVFVSSIPEGVYDVSKSTSLKFGRCFRFSHVPLRTGILIHAGNTVADTMGCILVGLDVNDDGVIYSNKALDRLFDNLPDNFNLTVRSI